MALGTFKTLVNVGMNISNDYLVPAFSSFEKNKNYEIRLYETNKYIVIKYKTVDKSDDKKSKSEQKQGNDEVMKHVWRIMKYTQGENDAKINMKFIMPVFVHVETLTNDEVDSKSSDGKLIEVKVMASLPPEYQLSKQDPNKTPLEPPKPLEADIEFETLEPFKSYVRTFGGFANDDVFKSETEKLREILKQENKDINLQANKIICISYDPPFKLFGRRNEIQLVST